MKNIITILVILSSLSLYTSANNNKPNILFAISDDQSFAHTSFVGCDFVNTPAFDQVAREGVYFSNCYAGSPGCAPSRSSIVTGRYPWQNEQSGQHASSWMKKYIPFIDLLEQNGYVTGRTGKGVDPFQYARSPEDSLWRSTNAAGLEHSHIVYKKGAPGDERTANGISNVNYFENFKYFVEHVRNEKPFFFWYGAKEPHRVYEQNSWKRNQKNLTDADVPEFFPDEKEIRGDLLDYAVEIEWFDLHLQRMLSYLDEIGELENTIVIVTSDNGMPFPRAKANCYDYGVHVPFAVRFPKEFPGNRIVSNPISFVDLAPTILELTNTEKKDMLPISGKSLLEILKSKKQGIVNPNRKYVLAGRERHSSSRYKNWGYPQRLIRSKDFLLVWNLNPERWPAGAPQAIIPETNGVLAPLYGIDESGKHHPEWAFTDIDASPTKSCIIENWNNNEISYFFNLALAKRPEFELFDINRDPFCLNNLSGKPEFIAIENKLKSSLQSELEKTGDPRIVGPDKEIFDSYIRYSPIRNFPKP
ncbi:sulfatase family protein [Sunxiuqinia sp. A32]|uniref:sulfatase family protein n=1 Tax=Sunxiuqinia sp. A32 TaxID=3461496 RepID=UPI004045A2FF